MKLAVLLLCGILVIGWNCGFALARQYGRRDSRSRKRERNSRPAVCELYSGGDFCEPYLKGQKIYVSKKRPQSHQQEIIENNYGLLFQYVSERCRDYVLPALCNYGFPPCDLTQSAAKPRKFCQDDCLVLKNDICKRDFKNALRFPLVSRLLPDCDSMPAKGQPGYKSCIRVVPQVPKFKVRLDHNITMFQNKPVIFKCRLNSKKIQVNITWFKDERPVNRMFPSYKVTSYRWGSKLKIRRAKMKDAGIFECRAKGPGGIVTARAWLKINGHLNIPPLPVIEKKHSTPQYEEGNDPDTTTPKSLPPFPGMCEKYRGKACAQFIGNQSIWVEYPSGYQQRVEDHLSRALRLIQATKQMSDRCSEYGIPALCFHGFPTCDTLTQNFKYRLCREDCFALFKDICLTELQFAMSISQLRVLLPNCSALPTRDDKDYSYCTSLNIPGLAHTSTSPPPPFIQDDSCYNGTGETYSGSRNVTKSGRPCRVWHPSDPSSHNYCRNPGGLEAQPWCHVGPENDVEYCDIKKCSSLNAAVETAPKHGHRGAGSVARTNYVISAIMAVLIVAFITIIVYLKIQQRKTALADSDHASSGSISKSTQSTLQQQNFDLKQSISEIKSCVFHQQDQKLHNGKVNFLEGLGEGMFVKVCRGLLITDDTDDTGVEIAIKRLKADVPEAATENFKKDTNILANLQDINILCMFGLSKDEDPHFMMFEYFGDMDLYRFLVDNASKLSGLIPSDISEYDLLLDFSLQIASGMDFLVENHFVHRDLAARNCYVTADNIIKISNLGIGSHKYPSDYSWVHSSALLPVRWMAPEALNTLKFNHMTDVWSYGVLLWEVYTFGCQPFTGFTNQEAIERIRNLELLSCPDHCPARMFGLMRECWDENPSDRSPFSEICSRLREWAGDSIAESR